MPPILPHLRSDHLHTPTHVLRSQNRRLAKIRDREVLSLDPRPWHHIYLRCPTNVPTPLQAPLRGEVRSQLNPNDKLRSRAFNARACRGGFPADGDQSQASLRTQRGKSNVYLSALGGLDHKHWFYREISAEHAGKILRYARK